MSQLTGETTKAQGPSFGLDSSVPDFNTETYRMLRGRLDKPGITTSPARKCKGFSFQDYKSRPARPPTINRGRERQQ